MRALPALVVAGMGIAGLAIGGEAFEGGAAAMRSFGHFEFNRTWFFAPLADEAESDGLGPLFSADSCASCHRGAALAGSVLPSSSGKPLVTSGFVVRLADPTGSPDPQYGAQIQTGAAPRVSPEASVSVWPPKSPGRPLRVDMTLHQGPLSHGVTLSPRLAPPLIGRAAIGRVDTAFLESLAARQAAAGTGVAGVVGRTHDGRIGVFGYNADGADLASQVSLAFSVDIGISSPLAPGGHGDCTPRQLDCYAAADGGDFWREGFETTKEEIDELIAYLVHLESPAQQRPDHIENPVFLGAGCAVCHVPTLPDRSGSDVVIYSDLLLHDMGPGLADGLGKVPSAWRTSPLLALAAYSGRRYLHDGRAGSLDEAIRAHGGEAEASRRAYDALGDDDRRDLLDFLEGL